MGRVVLVLGVEEDAVSFFSLLFLLFFFLGGVGGVMDFRRHNMVVFLLLVVVVSHPLVCNRYNKDATMCVCRSSSFLVSLLVG